MSRLAAILKVATLGFINDECMANGAALAFYTIFSLPPLLMLVFFVAGLFGVSDEKIDMAVRRQVGLPMPVENTQPEADEEDAVGWRTLAASSGEASQIFAALGPASKLLGLGILLFSATAVLAQLQAALNRAWQVEPDPLQGGMKNFVVKRVLSLGMIIVFAFLLLVSLVLSTLIDEVIIWIQGDSPHAVLAGLVVIVNNLIALAMATLLFAAVFKVLPDARMQWRDMWIGALITAVLFAAGKSVIGWYLPRADVGSAWGAAAASMIASLLWVYYTSLIVLFGAELTRAWASQYGGGLAPAPGAVRVEEIKRRVRD